MPPKPRNNRSKSHTTPSAVLGTSSRRGMSATVLRQNQTPRETRSSSRNTTPMPVETTSTNPHELISSDVVLVPSPAMTMTSAPPADKYRKAKKVAVGSNTLQSIPEISIVYGTVDAGSVPSQTAEHLPSEEEDSVSADSQEDLYETTSSIEAMQVQKTVEQGFMPPPSTVSSSSESDFEVLRSHMQAHNTKGKGTRKTKKPNPVTSDLENASFHVRIWFPFQGREKRIDAMNDMSYVSVRQLIANTLGIDVRVLRPLLYKVDCDTKQTSFREFLGQEDWEMIIQKGNAYRLKHLRKAGSDPDGWSVKMKELDNDGKAGKNATKGNGTRNKAAMQISSDDNEPISSPREKHMVQLMKARYCSAHAGKHCWLPTSSDLPIAAEYGLSHISHIQITDAELQKWVDEIISLDATLRSPGMYLARTICKRFANTLREKAFLDSLDHPAVGPPKTPQFSRMFAPPPVPTPQRHPFPMRSQSVPIERPPTMNVPFTTSNPFNTITTNAMATNAQPIPIEEWLPTLSGRLPGDPTDYTQLIPFFLDDEVRSTFEIAELKVAGLTGIGGIRRGLAARLIGWIKQDQNRNSNSNSTDNLHYMLVEVWLPSLSGRLPGDPTAYKDLIPFFIAEEVRSTFEVIELDIAGLVGIGGIKRGVAARLVGWAKQDQNQLE